jgi:predicted ferric reductase
MGRFVGWGIAIGVASLVVADALAARAGWVAGAIPRSDGPWWWVTSRAAGVAAFGALTLDVVFGLLLSTGAADRWVARARSVEVHRWLSSATLSLLAVHVLALLGDGFARFDVLDALVPFVASYRPAPLALGLAAAYLAVALHLSFELRQRIGTSAWRRLHRWSAAAFVLAAAHGLLAGSDSGASWMRALYVVAFMPTAGLLIVRVARRQRAVTATPSAITSVG